MHFFLEDFHRNIPATEAVGELLCLSLVCVYITPIINGRGRCVAKQVTRDPLLVEFIL